MDVTALPTSQDCHELWSKKRKRGQCLSQQPRPNEIGEPVSSTGLAKVATCFHILFSKQSYICFRIPVDSHNNDSNKSNMEVNNPLENNDLENLNNNLDTDEVRSLK